MAPQIVKVFWFFSSKKFFASLRQTLLDETKRCLPGEVPTSPKSDTGYEIFPANSDTDEPAKE
jgi:hypothetical protein